MPYRIFRLKVSTVLFFIGLFVFCAKTFAGIFIPAKGMLEMSVEYQGVSKDNKWKRTNDQNVVIDHVKGDDNGTFGHDAELDFNLGLTEKQGIGFTFSASKESRLKNDENVQPEDLSFAGQFKHTFDFKINDNIAFGLRNSLGFLGNGQGYYNNRWEIAGMSRYAFNSGFYEDISFFILFRRNFKYDNPDSIIFQLKNNFRITQKVNFLVQVDAHALLASQSYIDANPESAALSRLNPYSLRTFRFNRVELKTGPSYTLSSGNSFYVNYVMQLDASAEFRSHFKGIAIGYTSNINLKW